MEEKIKEECSICFDSLETKDIAFLNCNHVFHYKCIGEWMISIHKNKINTNDSFCPICWKGDEIVHVICREKYIPPPPSDFQNNILKIKKKNNNKCTIC